MSEVWKDVPGFEGSYEVSSYGRVKSLRRVVIRENRRPLSIKERILKPYPDHGGYYSVSLLRQGKIFHEKVHRLVAKVFIGVKPSGLEIAHNDGNKSNNAAQNLRYTTSKDNVADLKRHGVAKYGDRHPRAKLNSSQVAEIRASDLSQRKLAEKYGVSRRNIRSIKSGESWNDPRFWDVGVNFYQGVA